MLLQWNGSFFSSELHFATSSSIDKILNCHFYVTSVASYCPSSFNKTARAEAIQFFNKVRFVLVNWFVRKVRLNELND